MRRLFVYQTIALIVIGSSFVCANSDTLLPIQKNGKWGYINQNGKLIIPCKYDAALDWGTRIWGKVKLNDTWLNINRIGEQLSIKLNGTPKIFNDSIIIVSTPQGEFVCDDLGNKILSEPFNEVKKLCGSYFTYVNNDSIGIASIEKGKLTSAKFNAIEEFNFKNTFKIKICGYEGLIDAEGREIIPPIYNELKTLSNSKVVVVEGNANLEGVFDIEKRQIIITPLWNRIGYNNNWFTILENDIHTKVYFAERDWVDTSKFEMASIVNNLLFAVKNSLEGVMNEKAEIIVPFACSELLFEHNSIIAQKHDGYYLIDRNGNNLINTPFQEYYSIETPNFLFKQKDDSWTLYDSLGNAIHKDIFNPTIQQNIIKSKKNGLMTRIELNKLGRIQERSNFNNVVTLKVSRFIDNSKFKKNVSTQKDKEKQSSKRWFIDDDKRQYGLKAADGKILLKPQFDDIDLTKSEAYTVVYINTEDELITYGEDQFLIKFKAGLVHNETGKIVIPVQYAGIRITGDEKDPLIFAITKNFRFTQYLQNEDKMGETFLWVDQTKETPVRALKKSSMTKTSINKEMPQQHFNFTMLQFSNLHISPYKSIYYTDAIIYKSNDPIWTYVNNKGVTSGEFAYAEAFNKYDAARVIDKSNNKWGLINRKINFVVPSEFTSIVMKGSKYYQLCRSDSVHGIVYDNSKQTILENADRIISFNQNRTYYRGSYGAGFWSKERGDVLSRGSEDIRESSTSLIPIKKLNKWGYINENGIIAIECKYTKVNPFKNGYATVKFKGKWKLIDEQGNEVKELPWKNIKSMGDLLIVSNGNNWKVSSNGDLPDTKYPAFYGFRKINRSSFYWCKGLKQNFIINADGSSMIKTKHENVYFLGESAFSISSKKRKYLQFGENVCKTIPKKTEIMWVKGNLMGIQKSGKMYLCDTSFKMVSNKAYRNIKPSPEGNYIATDRKCSFILDSKGNEVLSSKMRIKENTKKNFNIAINENMQFVFLDSSGKQLLNRVFTRIVSDGNSNYWALNSNRNWGLLDPNLEWIIEPKFKHIQVISKGITRTLNENILGYSDLNGNYIVPAKYPSVEFLSGYFKAQIGDEVHWYNKTGKCIFGPNQSELMAAD